MKHISLDNGNTLLSASEAIKEIESRDLWQIIVETMDSDIREQVHSELAPCTRLEFLQRYLELAEEDLYV